jgi:hypothetical protein
MKYAVLIYSNPDAPEAASPEEAAAITAEYMALRDEAGCVDGAQLQPTAMTTTLRQAGGDTLITDGPFADTKEVLAGYFLFEADNLDRVLELAARIPALRFGGAVEVRPLVDVRAYAAEGQR